MDKYVGPERRNGINHLKELLEVKLESAEKALTLQAKEYERRLADLNGEAARLMEMQSKYLPRETYEIQHRELQSKIETNQKLIFIGMGIVLAIEFILRVWKG